MSARRLNLCDAIGAAPVKGWSVLSQVRPDGEHGVLLTLEGSVVASERISSTHLRRESFDVDPNCAMVLWAADAIRQVADRWAQAAGAEGA